MSFVGGDCTSGREAKGVHYMLWANAALNELQKDCEVRAEFTFTVDMATCGILGVCDAAIGERRGRRLC